MVIVVQHVGAVLTAQQPGVGAGFAAAQEEDKPKTRITQALDNKVYEKIQAAQKAAEDKNPKEAIAILDKLRSSKNLNDYELATVLNIYGFIYFTEENYPKAQQAYRQIISLPKAPEGTVVQARFSLAQAYFVAEQYAEGVKALKEWFKVTENPGANAYVLMAQGLHQMGDYDGALENINKAISIYKEKDKVPSENWYGLQSFLYYQKNDFKKVVQILDELLKYYPDKKYWIQLSAMYAELKDDKNQLAALETAYVQGMLSRDQELINLASLYLQSDVPYKAAKVLDKGIKDGTIEPTAKNLELLGIAWRSAQEIKKAIPEMAKAAAKSDKGDLWAQLCGVYLDNDEFEKAADACEKGIKKGGVKRLDTAYLYKGMAHFNLKEYNAARSAFKEAAKDERSKKYADQWLKYMDSELDRQRSLQEG